MEENRVEEPQEAKGQIYDGKKQGIRGEAERQTRVACLAFQLFSLRGPDQSAERSL